MSDRQRMFELIPISLVKNNGPKPPMTSKMAKKAHQLATRGPKVSRAEQRRRDVEELARQKREYEREKASARAKAAREKKAAREQAERDARKKTGIPEPSKFVRASQPTISRFVKNGNKMTWQKMDIVEEETDSTVCDEEVEQEDKVLEPPAKKFKAKDESEDEYGVFPSFSQSGIGVVLEDIESTSSEANQAERRVTLDPELISKSKPTPNVLAAKSSDEFFFESPDYLDDMVVTQLLSETRDAAARSAEKRRSVLQHAPIVAPPQPVKIPRPAPSIRKTKSGRVSPKPVIDKRPVPSIPTTTPIHNSPKPATTARPVLQERSVNMPPPPLPVQVKEKRSISFAPSPSKLRRPQRHPQSALQPNIPPSATQYFLEDNFDDFFPSPSQEIRELLDDTGDLPTNTQIAKELEPSLPIAKEPREDSFADLICTQDFILSSQDILEITTPCPPLSKPKAKQPTSTPTPLPTRPAVRAPSRRFFEEKDEDLLHAAIQESKMLSAQNKHGGQEMQASEKTKRTFKRTYSNATDYGEDEFYDCEEELLALC